MKNEKEFFLKGVSAVAVISLLALVYSALTIQSASEKIDSQGIILSILGSGGGNSQQNQLELAEISIITIVDSSIPNLVDLEPLALQVKQLDGVKVVSEKKLERGSGEASQLISKYGIERIPSLLIQGETMDVGVLAQSWTQIGSVENDNTMIFRNAPPLYLDLSSMKIRGITGAVYLSVPDRNEVLSVDILKQVLSNAFGIKPAEEKIIDYNSMDGKELIAKYNIEKIPTFFVFGDLNVYIGFEQAWLQAGSSEPDGNYVFRSLDLLTGLMYLDLNTTMVVEAGSLEEEPI